MNQPAIIYLKIDYVDSFVISGHSKDQKGLNAYFTERPEHFAVYNEMSQFCEAFNDGDIADDTYVAILNKED